MQIRKNRKSKKNNPANQKDKPMLSVKELLEEIWFLDRVTFKFDTKRIDCHTYNQFSYSSEERYYYNGNRISPGTYELICQTKYKENYLIFNELSDNGNIKVFGLNKEIYEIPIEGILEMQRWRTNKRVPFSKFTIDLFDDGIVIHEDRRFIDKKIVSSFVNIIEMCFNNSIESFSKLQFVDSPYTIDWNDNSIRIGCKEISRNSLKKLIKLLKNTLYIN